MYMGYIYIYTHIYTCGCLSDSMACIRRHQLRYLIDRFLFGRVVVSCVICFSIYKWWPKNVWKRESSLRFPSEINIHS